MTIFGAAVGLARRHEIPTKPVFGMKVVFMTSTQNDQVMKHSSTYLAACLAFFLLAGLVPWKALAQSSEDKSKQSKNELIREKWQHVGFHVISDRYTTDIPETLDDENFGFAFTYMKHDRAGVFDGGLDLGLQPFGTRRMSEMLWSELENDSVGADITLRSNLVHAHYLLRTTLFKNRGIQPYAELFGGMRGSIVTTSYELEGDNRLPGQLGHTSLNFSFGYAVGLRLKLTKRAFLNARLCQMSHLNGGNEIDVIDLDEVSINSQGLLDAEETRKELLAPYSARVGIAFDF